AFDRSRDSEGRPLGRAAAHSSFHHFADYNWDPAMGAPSFVDEPPGSALAGSPEARRSVERYVRNLAGWLAGPSTQRFVR
ncbi:MAG: hypothetical protein ACHQHK_16115, partial [Dongiales bacterium]